MFNEASALVKIYARNIKNGNLTLDQVPNLFNLKAVVSEVISETVK